MIHELRISGLGVIAEATCRFSPGFTAVTGETGAGKTMVVSGLGLLAGGRADPGLVRHGAPQAAVEGLLDVADPDVAAAITDAGGFVEDGTVTAARILAGRSRSVLGGRGVPTALLADVAGQLLAIHGQHEQVRLAARARGLLDAFAGEQVVALSQQVSRVHRHWRTVHSELSDLRGAVLERARELDLLEHSLAEIERIDPRPGEDEELAREAVRLANADVLAGAVRDAHEAICGSESAAAMDAIGLLAAARRALASAAGHDPALEAPQQALGSVLAELADVASELARYAEDIQADPGRLAIVEDRRSDLRRLTRKYGTTIDEVLAWSAQAAARVGVLAGSDERIEVLAEQERDARAELGRRCGQLRAARVAAADRFAERVAEELAALAMPGARVSFAVTSRPDPAGVDVPGLAGPIAVGPAGIDDVDLMLAANPGAPLRPIAQAASGGELSRVMLAVQVVLAGADPVPTMVFDEVDAGVGGAAAVEVGRRLRRLSGATQVIVVTHLPQVAAFADSHLVVAKGSDGSVTESSVRCVAGEDRVRELARMLAGLADSQSAGAHARELLDLVED